MSFDESLQALMIAGQCDGYLQTLRTGTMGLFLRHVGITDGLREVTNSSEILS